MKLYFSCTVTFVLFKGGLIASFFQERFAARIYQALFGRTIDVFGQKRDQSPAEKFDAPILISHKNDWGLLGGRQVAVRSHTQRGSIGLLIQVAGVEFVFGIGLVRAAAHALFVSDSVRKTRHPFGWMPLPRFIKYAFKERGIGIR